MSLILWAEKHYLSFFSGGWGGEDHTDVIAKEHNKEEKPGCDSVSDYICKGNCENKLTPSTHEMRMVAPWPAVAVHQGRLLFSNKRTKVRAGCESGGDN